MSQIMEVVGRTPFLQYLNSTLTTMCYGANCLYGGVQSLYDQHTRRDEFRRLQADNSVAASIAELRSVKSFVSARIIELRAEAALHETSVLQHSKNGSEEDAIAHFRLKLLYDGQITHTLQTAAAIEAHIISLEAQAIQRKVLRALKVGANAHSPLDMDEEESVAEAVSDTLSESRSTSMRIMEILSCSPDQPGDDNTNKTVEAMRQWIGDRPVDVILEDELSAILPTAPSHLPYTVVKTGSQTDSHHRSQTDSHHLSLTAS
jgi:hypothetical protein